jgi:hypothetical protein
LTYYQHIKPFFVYSIGNIEAFFVVEKIKQGQEDRVANFGVGSRSTDKKEKDKK